MRRRAGRGLNCVGNLRELKPKITKPSTPTSPAICFLRDLEHAAPMKITRALTDPKLHLFDKKGSPINGRAPWPRGCKRPARGRLVRTLRTDCDKRQLLAGLACAEDLPPKAHDQYWQHVFASGERCCRKQAAAGAVAGNGLLRATKSRTRYSYP